jgi:transketolase
MDSNTQEIEELGINTVRVLSADAVQKANSGHPGTAMALAPMGHVLWTKFLNYNPKNPDFANRDRSFLQGMPVYCNTTFCI